MAEPLIQVDDDWKKKAREEKAKLAEQAKAKQPPAPASPPQPGAAAQSPDADDDLPPADFAGLCQTLLSQLMLYLGLVRGAGPRAMDLDMARRQIDLLEMLKAKTDGNLDDGERQTLAVSLYEARTRFVSVASQQII